MEDRAEARRVGDALALGNMGGRASAQQFANAVGIGKATARRRLEALAEAGLASVEPDGLTFFCVLGGVAKPNQFVPTSS